MSASLSTGSYHNLRVAAADRLHQDYRLPLIEGGARAMALMEEEGAYCSYISGAGFNVDGDGSRRRSIL